MAHEYLYGMLKCEMVSVHSANEDGYEDVENWTIGGNDVARWLYSFNSCDNPRTVVIIHGDALKNILTGNIIAYEVDYGYSEVTPGGPAYMSIGGHDLRAYFENIGEYQDVALIILDPTLSGDVSELLLMLGKDTTNV